MLNFALISAFHWISIQSQDVSSYGQVSFSMSQVFYTSDAARESFVELCEEEYVQKAGQGPTICICHNCPGEPKANVAPGVGIAVLSSYPMSNFRENSSTSFSGLWSSWADQGSTDQLVLGVRDSIVEFGVWMTRGVTMCWNYTAQHVPRSYTLIYTDSSSNALQTSTQFMNIHDKVVG